MGVNIKFGEGDIDVIVQKGRMPLSSKQQNMFIHYES
jgi:hypothetical protein